MKTSNTEQSKLALAFSIGTVVISNIVGGVILGFLLDRWLKTGPWLLLVGIVLGTVGAFASLYRIVSRLNDN